MNAIHGLCLGPFFFNSCFSEESVFDKAEGKKEFSWL